MNSESEQTSESESSEGQNSREAGSEQNEAEIMEENAAKAVEKKATAINDAEKGEKTRLECMKAVVACIKNNINRNAVIPQKAVAFNGATNGEKIKNLASQALKSLENSQELPPKAQRILAAAQEEQLEGEELMESFRAIATITASENIEINRRTASLNKNSTEENAETLDQIVRPKVLGLMKQIYNEQAFASEEMLNFALKMEPNEVDTMSYEDLEKLEKDVGWIIGKLWGKTAGNIWKMILAKCVKGHEWNDRTHQRIIILTHIWNLRFKAILKLNPKERVLHNATERELCKTISHAIHGQILQTLSNTRCLNEELLTNAARTAKTHLDAIFSKFNPLSEILQEFLANADSNESFTNWDAITAIRSLWPDRNKIADSEARILNLNGIDERIELGLQNPDSLFGTSYLHFYKKRKANSYGARKRKWSPERSEWGQNLETDRRGNQGGSSERPFRTTEETHN
ncbi:unnamed protein product [Oikopleura dioica]|uniref:Uncharacterized protein n=1 Tax=Oikopleura dioica TaxID=34765 RepID=E4XPC4_OIKDI|nr:unnamed protein product [Oikopleura dioica]